jgi:hypothetical protein
MPFDQARVFQQDKPFVTDAMGCTSGSLSDLASICCECAITLRRYSVSSNATKNLAFTVRQAKLNLVVQAVLAVCGKTSWQQ